MSRQHGFDEDDLERAKSGEYLDYLRGVALAGCDRQRYAPRQRRVQRMLQAFVNKTKMSREEIIPVLRRLAAFGMQTGAACGTDPVVRWVVCGPPEQEPPDSADFPRTLDTLDALERSGKLDDRARFALLLGTVVQSQAGKVESLYRSRSFERYVSTVPQFSPHARTRNGAEWAASVADVRAIAWPGLRESLLQRESDPVVRFQLGLQLEEIRQGLQSALGKHPTQLVDRALAAQAAWRTAYSENGSEANAALSALKTTNDAQCRGLDDALRTLLQKLSPETLEHAQEATRHPIVHLVLQAQLACAGTLGRKSMQLALESLIVDRNDRYLNHVRGPRKFSLVTLVGFPRYPMATDQRTVRGRAGNQIEFSPRVHLQPREKCWETNKIAGVSPAGEVYYREECTELPPLRNVEPYRPMTVPAEVASAVKANSVVDVIDAGGPAVAVAAYDQEEDGRQRKNLRVFLNVALR